MEKCADKPLRKCGLCIASNSPSTSQPCLKRCWLFSLKENIWRASAISTAPHCCVQFLLNIRECQTAYSLFNIIAVFPRLLTSVTFALPPHRKEVAVLYDSRADQDPALRKAFFSLYGLINILLSVPGKSTVRFIRAISGDSEPSILNH